VATSTTSQALSGASLEASQRHAHGRRRRSVAVALVAFVVLTAVAFAVLVPLRAGGSHSGPGDVVRAARLAANQGRYTEANRYLSKAMLALARQQRVDMVAVWDWETRGRQLRSVTILATTLRRHDALVAYTITYADGITRTDTTRLVREDGQWKEAP